MAGTLSPSPVFQGWTDAGLPLDGGLLNVYASGTAMRATTYSDAALTTPNSNPVVLNSAGRATVYLSSASFKFVLTDSLGAVVWTADPVQSVAAGATSGLGEIFVFGGDPNTPVTVTAYPSGATFDKLHGGTAVYVIDSGNLAGGTYILEAMGVVAAGTLTVAIVDLDDGAPDTPLATLTIISATGARAQSGAITFAAAGVAKTYGIKVKQSAGTGYAWGARLVRTA